MKQFDHHCLWLNNCIGANNYKTFIVLVYSYFGHAVMTIVITVAGLQMLSIFEEAGAKTSVLILWKTVTIVLMVVEILKIIGVAMLIVWHIVIWHLGISTYQFIVEKQKMDSNKRELKKGEITQE